MRLLILVLLFCNLYAQSKQLTICKDCPIVSIKQGIVIAQGYDTLIVLKGIYREGNIIVNKPLTIIGKEYPTIDGENKEEIFTLTSDNIALSGMRMINVGKKALYDAAAIKIKQSKKFLIADNFLENVYWGIYLEKSKQGIIRNNQIKGTIRDEFNSGNGIHLWHCSEVTISDNHISQTRDGIYFEFVDRSKIINNVSVKNLRYGLHFMFSNNDLYVGNRFEENGAGVAVMFSKHIVMKNNFFVKNWTASSYGLLLKEINDAQITGNIFYKNTLGVQTEGSNRISYTNNLFESNGWSVRILGACLDNVFTHNNFIGNTFDLVYSGQLNDNIFDGNYWSTYTGYDLDKDGVGDVPHRPVKLFSYIISQTQESIILLRSLFVDLLNFSEKVFPVFTPKNLVDQHPFMQPISDAKKAKPKLVKFF